MRLHCGRYSKRADTGYNGAPHRRNDASPSFRRTNAAMVKIISTLSVLVIGVGLICDARAISPSGDFRCLAVLADNIAVVRDKKSDRFVMEDYLGKLYITTLVIEKQFKNYFLIRGKHVEDVDMIVRRDDVHAAGSRLADGASALIFIRNTSNGPEVLGDSAGVVPYDDGVVIHGVKLNDKAISLFIKNSVAANPDCPRFLPETGSE